MRLGVFSGDRYWRKEGVVSSDVAFVHFLAGLSEQLEELVLFGRLDPRPALQANPLHAPRLRFVPLPHYERLGDVGAVVRSLRGSSEIFERSLEGLDAVWLFGPHPLLGGLARIADRSSLPIVLGARTDFPRYVASRSPGWAKAWQLPVAHWLDYSFRRLTRRCPTVVVSEDLARRYGGPRTLVTGFSLVREADLGALRHGALGESVRVLSVTRLETEKNPLLLAEILAVLRAHGDWRLTVVGDGPLRGALAQRARSLGVADALDIEGWVPFGSELRKRYRQADAFLHVSLTEGLPQVLFEAAAAGLPIVGTDVGGVGEALGNGERGLLVAPRDAQAAAGALLSLRDAALRDRLVQRGFEFVRTRTLEAQAAAIVRFIAS